MNRIFLILVLILATFMFACGRRTTMQTAQYDNPDTSMTLEQMKTAIKRGCENRQWEAKEIDANTIEATVTVRGKHRATVTIPYTNTHYEIKYKDSVGLRYRESGGEVQVHRAYNRWVNYLNESIQEELDSVKNSNIDVKN